MTQIKFNPATAKDMSFEPIPAGWYAGTLISTEWKDTNDESNDHQYLKCRFQVDGDQHPGAGSATLWLNLNLVNSNPKAVAIAESQLKALCEACSVANLEDDSQLIGIPIAMKVTVKPASGGYEAGNEIKTFEPHSSRFGGRQAAPQAAPGTAPQQAAPSPTAAAPAPEQAGGDKPAWMK